MKVMNDLWRKESRDAKKGSRSSKGAATRTKILAHAMAIAAREGVAGLTIGRLARDLRMSKSGLFAHFRSKRSLEMATINEARKVFADQVLSPAAVANEGIERLWVLCDSWIAHIERKVFPGGYFFIGAFFECAERSGPIEEEINRMAREWWEMLSTAVRKAQERKEINLNVDARRIGFDLNGVLMAAYWTHLVEKDNEVFREARMAIRAKLKELSASRVSASTFKMENTRKEERPANERLNIFRRPGATVKSSTLSPPSPPPTVGLPRKSRSVLFNLSTLTKR
jgi:AcrR family transcriptional regulator